MFYGNCSLLWLLPSLISLFSLHRDEFESKHRHWGTILMSNARYIDTMSHVLIHTHTLKLSYSSTIKFRPPVYHNIITRFPPSPSSWAELHLPVCHALLLRSRCYLCSLVMRFAELALSEASKITDWHTRLHQVCQDDTGIIMYIIL